MNLTALASLAGVSVSTVSKAFSGSSEISEETRERIFTLAKAQGCYDRYNKNKFSKKVIAVLVPELKSSFYSAIVPLLDGEIAAAGGVMICASYNFSEDRKAELFHYFGSYCKADGILLVDSCKKLKNPQHIPAIALYSDRKLHPEIDMIPAYLNDAILAAILHLKEHGHKDIGFVGEINTEHKVELFRSAMRHAGLPLQNSRIKTSQYRFEEAGTQAVEEWLAEDSLPTAILAAYDNIAIGLIKALTGHGIRVPEQVSVIGMDDISVAPYLETSLSTIRLYGPETCRYAVELMMKKLDHPFYTDPEPKVFAAAFIPRSSSGPCPK